MNKQTKVAAVILAGGRARRMHHQDKGLVNYRDRPLVAHAIDAVTGVTSQIIISANRNQDRYRRLGFPVVTDLSPDFSGPLAGILAAMMVVKAEVLLIVPCDSPLIKAEHLQRLLSAIETTDAEASVAFDGERLHPVFLALKTCLQANLQDYLNSDRRKVEDWLMTLNTVLVNLQDASEIFYNVNTLADLAELERKADGD